MNNIVLRSLRALITIGAVACSSADGGATVGEENLECESRTLTLENVYLGHADLATWEPGDPQYHFPVAAEIFYGYRPIDGYTIEVSDNCRDSIEVKAEGTGPDAAYALWCSPNGMSDRSTTP